MAAGTPLIVDSTHPARSIIDNEKTGLIVTGSDANAIAHGIIRIIDEPKLAQQIRTASKKYFEDQFSVKQFSESLADIYKQAFRGQRVCVIETSTDVQSPESIKLVASSTKNTTASFSQTQVN